MSDVRVDEQILSDKVKAATLTTAKAASPEKTVDILVAAGVIDTKPWWRSIGVNGSLVTLSSLLVPVAAEVAPSFGWKIDVAATTEAIMGLIALIGAAMTWWGRIHSAQPISRVAVLPGVTLKGDAP